MKKKKKINVNTQNSGGGGGGRKIIDENYKIALFLKDDWYLKKHVVKQPIRKRVRPSANTGKTSIWRQIFSPRSIRMNF